MARCIKIDEARRRREQLGRPLRRRSKTVSNQGGKKHPARAARKPRSHISGASGWMRMSAALAGMWRLLAKLLFNRNRKIRRTRASTSDAGPLAS
jgi:hypothetical protein